MKSADLFEELKPPRGKPRRMMHVYDAGEAGGMQICTMRCNRCGHVTDWTEFATVTRAKRGIPCPSCNPKKTP